MIKHLTTIEILIVENALKHAIKTDLMVDKGNEIASELLDMLKNSKRVTIRYDSKDEDDEQRALDAMEAAICRGENSFGDD